MNVASLELCKELYELSGWGWHYKNSDYTDYMYEIWVTDPAANEVLHKSQFSIDLSQYTYCPAYDLGYLLRKLPQGTSLWQGRSGNWHADLKTKTARAETPENAAAKLAIQLFKQGVLK